MKVLMLGWELPPHHTGGLGEACLCLSRALTKKGVEITFVLPKKQDFNHEFLNLLFADIDEVLEKTPSVYASYSVWEKMTASNDIPPDFLLGSIKYAEKISKLAKKMLGKFDLIHVHDWMTYSAGIAAQRILKIPLVSHVHATEYNRSGGNWPNPDVYAIEKRGLTLSDMVLPVGKIAKDILVERYGISPGKIQVVYNGIDSQKKDLTPALRPLKKAGYKLVLFFGRITLQKGPEYFVRAAKKIADYCPKTIFVVGGSGDMQDYVIAETIRLGIHQKFIFTGAVWGDDKDRLFQAADVYVMPSVSEPFGIVALEGIVNETPVIISKQSGASEILNHALKVDFWDVDEIANKVITLLKHKSLPDVLKSESAKEVRNHTWEKAADQVLSVYKSLI